MPSRSSSMLTGLLACVAVALPAVAFVGWSRLPTGPELPLLASGGTTLPPTSLSHKQTIVGERPAVPPRWTNVQVIDFDKDGMGDILACDARFDRVVWYRQTGSDGTSPTWEPHVLGDDLIAPAHATPVDLDGDGDLDVVVSVLGNLWPDDGVIGRVVWLENRDGQFVQRVILDDVRRVADVQPGDFDGDGDVDLVVAVFGYARGEVLWLENRGEESFRDHHLFAGAGVIHVPVSDLDQDGDLDIATVVSQDTEEVWGFENDGHGQFESHRLFGSINFDLGSAGLVLNDLDQDGDDDLLLPVGDNLEDIHSYPQPYHGCLWFENKGRWKFETHHIARFGGTYAAAVGDHDGDGDRDVVLVSMFNDWDHPGHTSVCWLENDGHQRFASWQLAEHPTHLVTVASGDLNGDGVDDIVAGALHLVPPTQPADGITAWLSSTNRLSSANRLRPPKEPR